MSSGINEFDRLISTVVSAGRQVEFFGPQSEDAIDALNRWCGGSLPLSYLTFLKVYGGGGELGAGIAGIYENDPFMEGLGSMYGETMLAREIFEMPEGLAVVFANFEAEAIWCFDLLTRQENGELSVVAFNTDTLEASEVISRSFETFFREYLNIRIVPIGMIDVDSRND
jgi:antitoxin YobK